MDYRIAPITQEDRESYIGSILMRVANTGDMEVVDRALEEVMKLTSEIYQAGIKHGKSQVGGAE